MSASQPEPGPAGTGSRADPARPSGGGRTGLRGVRRRGWVLLVVAGLVLALAGGVVGCVIGRHHGHWDSAAGSRVCDSVSVAQKVLPSVVTLTITGPTGASGGS